MSSLKIQKLDPIEHILKRPDMYVGSVRPKTTNEYVALKVNESFHIQKQNISFPPALLRVFVEALSNAIDNAQRSRDAGITPSKIKVSIDKETGLTSVWNDGLVIPVLKDESDGVTFKHSLIFGELRTSTNFDDDEERTVSGRNGLGVKLLNVFSKKFVVKGVDPEQKLSFEQEWTNNMRNVGKPKISSSSLKNGFTEVSWIPDFEVFGIDGYTDDLISLYTRYVCDAAMLTKLNVYLNDEKLPIKSLQDYAKLYQTSNEDDDEEELNEESEDGASPSKKRKTPSKSIKESVYIKGKDSEVLLTCGIDEFEAISFVNGVFTINGGKHVEGWSEALFRPLVDFFNKPKKPQVNIKDVKQFFRLFVVSTLVNPEFSSQSKTELTSPDVNAEVDPKVIKAILKWECTNKISDIIHSKEMLGMKKSESKKKGYKSIEGYDPANEAGGKNSSECTLVLCEGLSAKTFAVKGMDSELFGKSGRDWIGIYPLRGKFLNVRKSNPTSIASNRVITNVIQAVGLRYGVDYRDDENFKQLYYGRIMIIADADPDGKHITGLLINFIHFLFPTLLQREKPFLVDMITPLAKFKIAGEEERVFFDLHTADAFYKDHKGGKIEVSYYKGLGTHSDEEIAAVFGKRVLSYILDEKANTALVKAFGLKETDERKQWIEDYNPDQRQVIDDATLYKDISAFIDEDLITFSIDDCKRSIPNVIDGLKQSQRKILYACFLRNLTHDMKVAQLAGYVAEKTNYHHGEQNLHDTITKMANDFVGSNNVPFLFRKGQFGSRLQNGKDAANARYIFTRLEKLTRSLFCKEDDDLLDTVIDDGDFVEPKFYVPIIPTILINGSDGIGTGWSTNIPRYNPLDVIACVRTWIETQEVPAIVPWYRGFTGTIVPVGEGLKKFTCSGTIERDEKKPNQAIVTEIPINMSIQTFTDFVSKLKEDKKIKDYKNYSSANHVNFVIFETQDTMRCTLDNLKLTSTINIGNMVMFDEHFKIKKFNSVESIIESFCKVRMEYYVRRKQKLLDDLHKKITIMTNKKRFIEEVIEKVMVINRKKQETIERELLERGYDTDADGGFGYLLRLQVSSFTEEKIEELQASISKMQAEIEKLTATPEQTLWLDDLQTFEDEYKKWLADMTMADAKRVKAKRPTVSGTTKTKRVKKI